MKTSVDELLDGCSDSIFRPESRQDVRDRLARIAGSECRCSDSSHENALHDLAHDDVPALLLLIDGMDRKLQRLRELCDENSYGTLGDEHPWAAIRTAAVREILDAADVPVREMEQQQ